jgi:hypothetical protein
MKREAEISVGIAAVYGLEGLDSIPSRGHLFYSTAPRPTPGHIHPPIQWVLRVLSPEVKRPERVADNSSSPRGQE